VLLEVGVVDAHLGLSGRALAGEAPLRERRAVEVERVPIGQVLGRDPAVELAGELLDLVRLVVLQAIAEPRAHGVDERGVVPLARLQRHDPPSLAGSLLPRAAAVSGRALNAAG
jgi:hypothetical protein